MRPPRVAVVITRLEGGAGVVALRGARALRPEDGEVTVICGSGRLVEQASRDGVRVVVEPSLQRSISPGRDLVALVRLFRLLRGFDVVHTHCAKAGALGRIAARWCGVRRVVHTFHGFPFHEFQRWPRHRAYVAIERRLGRVTDVALCVGNGVAAEAVRRRLLPPERIRATRVAVDLEAPTADPPNRARARRQLGLGPDVLVVGAVGRVTYQKAPEDFVGALAQLGRSDVVGVWVGDGDLAPRMRELAERRGVDVRWIGERTDVVDLLPAFDLFVLPSRYEGLPLSVVEAVVCGVPVVVSAVNSVGDLVIHGETGMLVPPRRPASLAAAIAHLLEDRERAGRMAELARAQVDDGYGRRALGDALAAAYLPDRHAR
jgi:glycosyltransferase involved in cell wall biosynthesis